MKTIIIRPNDRRRDFMKERMKGADLIEQRVDVKKISGHKEEMLEVV